MSDKPLLRKWRTLLHAAADQRLCGADLRVLVAVLDRMNNQMECWPGYGRIAADTQVSRRTATRSIERLVGLGYLAKKSRGICKSNLYRLRELSVISSIDEGDTSDEGDNPLSTKSSPALSVNVTPEPDSLNPSNETTQGKPAPTPYQKIVEAYHEQCPMLAKVVKVSDGRKKAMKARHNDLMKQNLERWSAYFNTVAASDFLTGKCPPGEGRSKRFVAGFDWLLEERNMIKVIEGNYDNGESNETNPPSRRVLNPQSEADYWLRDAI